MDAGGPGGSPAIAGWLARLPADAQSLAQAHTDLKLIAWLAGGLMALAACGLLARLDLAGRLARRLERDKRRPWLAAAAAGALVGAAVAAFQAPVTAWAAWRGALMDGTPADMAGELGAAFAGVPGLAATAAVVAALGLALIRARPRAWPWFTGAGVIVVALALGWLPYALSLGPPTGAAAPTPARDAVAQMIYAAGLPTHEVRLAPALGLDADVTGGFGRAQVVMGPELLASPPAQAKAYVAHVTGHYAHNDILIVTLLWCLVVGAGLLVVQRAGAALARIVSGQDVGGRDVGGLADPAVLPTLALLMLITLTAANLAGAAYLRWANVRADTYALEISHEPEGLAGALEQQWLAEPGRDALTPSWLEELVFYTHPPLPGRLAHAMAWKSAHGGVPAAGVQPLLTNQAEP